MKRLVPIAALLMLAAGPAIAHVGHGSTASFAAGLGHPLGGLDHVTVMVLVGLWAGLKGGRALWGVFEGAPRVVGLAGAVRRINFVWRHPRHERCPAAVCRARHSGVGGRA